jgi:transposase
VYHLWLLTVSLDLSQEALMSLQPQLWYVVPEATAQVAHAAFPHGNLYMRLYDTFGVIFHDHQFAALFSNTGQPAESPVRVALATILQFAEGLSDRQAADAVRSRIDWKYLLCLELTDSGFDHTVLCEFRSRLLKGQAEGVLFETLLTQFRQGGLLKSRGKQRTDSTHVLAAIRALNRLECVGETMRHALNTLAMVAPDWLLAHSQAEWVDRYGPRVDDYRLPESQADRQAYAELIATDGQLLLTAIYAATDSEWLRQIPAVQTLRQVWLQNYTWSEASTLAWREAENIAPAEQFIGSPYDVEAHYARKRSSSWVGYKVHLTETCDPDTPSLITHVETTSGPTADGAVVGCIHETLKERDLLPRLHLVDMGYIDAELLVTSQQEYGVELYGPARADYHQQAQTGGGFAAEQFRIDWEAQQAICPAGRRSISWTPAVDRRTNDVIKIKFATTDCSVCVHQRECTDSRPPRRTLTIRPKDQYEALRAARERERTAVFKEQYALRAGVEGTLSQGIRAFEMRRSRYIGLARTHLQNVLTATAMNLVRVSLWLSETLRAKTRQSAFQRLIAAAA